MTSLKNGILVNINLVFPYSSQFIHKDSISSVGTPFARFNKSFSGY
jgi:hypothetical protein